MRFVSLGVSDQEISEKLLAMGVPAFTASLLHDEKVGDEVITTPVWTLEDLLQVCRKAQKKEEVERIFADYLDCDYKDVGFLIMHEFTSEEDIADDSDFIDSYLEATLRFMECYPDLFDYGKLEKEDFWGIQK